MSKNSQRNQAEVNLGNETYDRGLADGIAGRPQSIKKTHRHAHRYYIGYRQGQRQNQNKHALHHANSVSFSRDGVEVTIHGNGAEKLKPRQAGLLTRIWGWIRT
jgi:hypothetical protein